MDFKEERLAQLQLPGPADTDSHPWLPLEGRVIHAWEDLTALFPVELFVRI